MANGGAGVLIAVPINLASEQIRKLERSPIGIVADKVGPGEECFILRASKLQRIWHVPFREGYWEEWALEARDVEPWFCPSHGVEMVNEDGDNRVELATRHLICGEAHVDVIGDIRVIFRWDGTALAPVAYRVFADGGVEVLPE